MYADKVTDSMKAAINETQRRRTIQEKFNEEHHITPKTIIKPIRAAISSYEQSDDDKAEAKKTFAEVDYEDMSKADKKELVANLRSQMQAAAKKLDFEQAASLRDTILELQADMS